MGTEILLNSTIPLSRKARRKLVRACLFALICEKTSVTFTTFAFVTHKFSLFAQALFSCLHFGGHSLRNTVL